MQQQEPVPTNPHLPGQHGNAPPAHQNGTSSQPKVSTQPQPVQSQNDQQPRFSRTPPRESQPPVANPNPLVRSTPHPTKLTLLTLVERIHSITVCPPPSDPEHAQQIAAEFDQFFGTVYATGLCSFFETRWYELNKPDVASNPSLLHIAAAFIESIRPGYPHPDHASLIESQILWALATQVYVTRPGVNRNVAEVEDDNALELMNRVRVFEVLMGGQHLPETLLMPPPRECMTALTAGAGVGANGSPASTLMSSERVRQFQFWHLLSRLVFSGPGVAQLQDKMLILDGMRKLLDGRENRDLLYSIAVLRVLGAVYSSRKVESGYASKCNGASGVVGKLAPVGSAGCRNENNMLDRWTMAAQFVKLEKEPWGGTMSVVRRFSELAWTAFVTNGCNCDAWTTTPPAGSITARPLVINKNSLRV